ncbi:regulator of Vps4 activity in the MVB pathway-domain-containing protein [Obelidium mucronatum]|nr:regulator of Vps4 activity in the MVB pathway-domain-containing protein [Obelidium mucronatum]
MVGFNPTKTKVQLKLAINRLKLLQQKLKATSNNAQREIAGLLEAGKDDSARVKVEHIIRQDFDVEAMEIIELFCETLLARFGLLEERTLLDTSIEEAVNTIIWASARLHQVKELSIIRDQLSLKFGRDLEQGALEGQNACVNPRVIHKLNVKAPDELLVDQYLKAIANAYNVQWDGLADSGKDDLLGGVPTAPPMMSQTAFAYPAGAELYQGATTQQPFFDPNATVYGAPGPSVAPLQPNSSAAVAGGGLSGSLDPQAAGGQPSASTSTSISDMDLTRRFEALKRKY